MPEKWRRDSNTDVSLGILQNCKNFKNTYFAEYLRTTASKPINFLLPASFSNKVIWNWVEIFWINLFSVYHQSQLVSTYWWSKKGIHYIKLKILKIKAYTEKNTTIFCIRSCFYVVQLIFRYLDCLAKTHLVCVSPVTVNVCLYQQLE